MATHTCTHCSHRWKDAKIQINTKKWRLKTIVQRGQRGSQKIPTSAAVYAVVRARRAATSSHKPSLRRLAEKKLRKWTSLKTGCSPNKDDMFSWLNNLTAQSCVKLLGNDAIKRRADLDFLLKNHQFSCRAQPITDMHEQVAQQRPNTDTETQ